MLLFMFIRRELGEERYRMFISVYMLCVCYIVQQGDWSGLVYYKQVPMLSPKNKDAKVLDVKL